LLSHQSPWRNAVTITIAKVIVFATTRNVFHLALRGVKLNLVTHAEAIRIVLVSCSVPVRGVGRVSITIFVELFREPDRLFVHVKAPVSGR
jgi:hypothetical protein